MASLPLSQYKSAVERALEAGNATEHAHRTTMKTLIEQLTSDLIARNKPKQVACRLQP